MPENGGFRAPFVSECIGLTSLWACSDWTVADGRTRVVPCSFRMRRNPRGEGDDRAAPIEGSRARSFCRTPRHGTVTALARTAANVSDSTPRAKSSFTERWNSYAELPDEIVDRNPAVLRRMIGRDDPFGKQTATSTPHILLARMKQWAEASSYI
jgi:hypothetical protein